MRFLRKILIILVAVVLCLGVLIIIAANVFLNTNFLPNTISKKPEKLKMGYTFAWTIWPQIVHVHGFHIQGTSKKDRWSINLDDVTIRANLYELTQRQFHAMSVDARGAVVRLEKLVSPGSPAVASTTAPGAAVDPNATVNAAVATETAAGDRLERGADPAAVATVEPAVAISATPANPPNDVDATDVTADLIPVIEDALDPNEPDELEDPNDADEPELALQPTPAAAQPDGAPAKPKKPPWKIILDNVHISGMREVAIFDYRITGDAELTTPGFALHPKTFLQVQPADIEFHGGKVMVGDYIVADDFKGIVHAELKPTDMAVVKGKQIMLQIKAESDLTGIVHDVRFLDYYLKNVQFMKLKGGAGDLAAKIKLEDGAFQPGMHLTVTAKNLETHLLGRRMEGTADVVFEVEPNQPEPVQAHIALNYRDVAIYRPDWDGPTVTSKNIRVDVKSPDRRIFQPFKRVNLEAELVDAVVPSLTTYNRFMPKGLGLTILSGTGTAKSAYQLSSETGMITGVSEATADNVKIKMGSIDVTASWKLSALVKSGNMKTKTFQLDGTRLDLHDVSMVDRNDPDPKHAINNWSATIDLPALQLTPTQPITFDATLKATLQDVKPLFMMLSAMGDDMPGVVKKITGEKDFTANANVLMGNDYLEVKNLEILGGKSIEILLKSRRRATDRVAVLYASYGVLSVGLERIGDKMDPKITGPKKWFLNYPSFDSALAEDRKERAEKAAKEDAEAKEDARKDAEKAAKQEEDRKKKEAKDAEKAAKKEEDRKKKEAKDAEKAAKKEADRQKKEAERAAKEAKKKEEEERKKAEP